MGHSYSRTTDGWLAPSGRGLRGALLILMAFAALGAREPRAVQAPKGAVSGRVKAPRPSRPPGAPDLGPDHTWSFLSAFRDERGNTHTRWEHRYRGLRVWGSRMITHGTPGGATLPATPSLALGPYGAPPVLGGLEPTVGLDEARAAVRRHLGGAEPVFTTEERVIFPHFQQVDLRLAGRNEPARADLLPTVPTAYSLAYLLCTDPGQGGGGARYLVDAHTGRVLKVYPNAWNQAHPSKGLGHTLYSGDVLLDTTTQADVHVLWDQTRGKGANTVVDRFFDPTPPLSGVFTLWGKNEWGDGDPEHGVVQPRDANYFTVAADAAYGVQASWDYFLRVHGRNGLDGEGGPVTVDVHVGDAEILDNASYMSGKVRIGEAREDWPKSDLGTLGHELAHGVVDNTAGFFPDGESGALAESAADFFSQMIQTYVASGGGAQGREPIHRIGDAGTPWVITHRSSDPHLLDNTLLVRCMFDPTLAGDPDEWDPRMGFSPDSHSNAGPMNRVFYLLSRGASLNPAYGPGSSPDPSPRPIHCRLLPLGMEGLGNDRTAHLWYWALASDLQPYSTFRDARRAVLQAARTLYGPRSREEWAVRRAFAAIGVGKVESEDLPGMGMIFDRLDARVEGPELVLRLEVSHPQRVVQVAFLVDGIVQGMAARGVWPLECRLPARGLLGPGIHHLQVLVRDLEDQAIPSPVTTFHLPDAGPDPLGGISSPP